MNRRRLAALAAATLIGTATVAIAPASGLQLPVLDTYVVTFDQPPTTEQLEMLGGVAAGVHGFTHVPAAAVTLPAASLAILVNLPGVRRVVPNSSYAPLLRQSTSTLRADAAWDIGWTGEGVGIAVIDTGIDGTHPDLCAAPEFCLGTPVKTVQNVKLLGRQDVSPEPVVVLENQINTDTSSGHGTHVAGIAGGAGTGSLTKPRLYRGVAPAADLIGLGTGEAVEAVNVLAAFDWVIEHADEYAIKVINNSWGPGAGTPFDPEDPVHRAIDAAHAAGLTVVFGAGNGGPSTDSLNAFSVNPNAISAAGSTKDGHIAFFSSRGVPGSELWRPTVTAPGYMIAAPRASTGFYATVGDLLAPNPDTIAPEDLPRYATGSGTSMAAPHVAGVVALMQQAAYTTRGTWLTPDEVRAILQHTAVRDDSARGPGGMPNYQAASMGAGHVDALAATQAAAAGTHTHPFDDGVVEDVRAFAGQIGPAVLIPTQTFDTTIDVLPGARSLNVIADWDVVANDVDIELFRPDGSLAASTFLLCNPDGEPNGYSSFCTQVPNERLTVVNPTPGTWRAVVRGGLLAVVENVRGLWSIAYPDGTPLPPAPTAASVSVTGATLGVAVTGQDVEIVATVLDADGLPVPATEVTWTSAGVGEVISGETTTHAGGWAKARVTSSLPGAQQITATAGGTSGTVTVTWLGLTLPPLLSSTPGVASGGGWIDPGGVKRNFGFFAEYHEGVLAGELQLHDHGSGKDIRGQGVDRLTITGSDALVTGPASFNGQAAYRYRLEIHDGGTPGKGNDTFRLVVTKPLNLFFRYEVSGTLGGGNLKVTSD